jgi:hypothetical protein
MANYKHMNDPALVSYVKLRDVRLVIARIPGELRARVRDVFLSSRSFGVRVLGSVVTRGRRDIDLFSVLPPRVSLRRFIGRGQSAAEFGAPRHGQWPPWAVRRYLLYDVLLHELGHLQVVRPKGRGHLRKFAGEPLAQKFADDWRRTLYAERYDHPDPIHNAPTEDELATLSFWEQLDKARKEQLVHLVLGGPHAALPDLSDFRSIAEAQRRFLRRAFGFVEA